MMQDGEYTSLHFLPHHSLMKSWETDASMTDTKNHKEAKISLCDSPLPKSSTWQINMMFLLKQESQIRQITIPLGSK